MASPVKASRATEGVVLYHIPPSFYSQIARLGLAEKGVAYEARAVVVGPPTYESYEPWYLRLNPSGTVPTLVVGQHAVPDSRAILAHIESSFPGPPLLPDGAEARTEVEAWVERAYGLSERVSAYGSRRLMGRIGARVNHGRRRALMRGRAAHPDLAEVYEAKITDIDRFIEEAADEQTTRALADRYESSFDALDAQLEGRDFVCSEQYSLADLVWTVTVARRRMLGGDPTETRPALQRWYARMRERPSFVTASIWERAHPEQMLPILWEKVPAHLVGIAVFAMGTLGFIIYGLIRLVFHFAP